MKSNIPSWHSFFTVLFCIADSGESACTEEIKVMPPKCADITASASLSEPISSKMMIVSVGVILVPVRASSFGRISVGLMDSLKIGSKRSLSLSKLRYMTCWNSRAANSFSKNLLGGS